MENETLKAKVKEVLCAEGVTFKQALWVLGTLQNEINRGAEAFLREQSIKDVISSAKKD